MAVVTVFSCANAAKAQLETTTFEEGSSLALPGSTTTSVRLLPSATRLPNSWHVCALN